MVDRHRACRHFDLGDIAAVTPEMADVDQSNRRSDDHLCRDLRGHVPAVAHGTPVVFLLAFALSEHDAPVAAVSQCAHLGCLRRQHLFYGVTDLLVHRHDSRPGDAARSSDHRADAK